MMPHRRRAQRGARAPWHFLLVGALLLWSYVVTGSPSLASVTAKVTPATLFGGGTLVLTCRVAPDDRNRLLDGVLPGYTLSERPLEGAAGPVTTRFVFTHVDCAVEAAVCTVTRNDGTRVSARATVLVACPQ